MKSNILACFVLGLLAAPSQAAIVMTMTQVGSDVVLSGSGRADISTLGGTPAIPDSVIRGLVWASSGTFAVGSPFDLEGPPSTDLWSGIDGPMTLGSGEPATVATNGTGSAFGIFARGTDRPFLLLPVDYRSNAPLTGSSTFSNTTLAALGVNTGTYVWTWGSGSFADSLTLTIGETTAPPVPLPAAAWLLLSGLAGLGVVGRRKRSKASA